MSGPSSGTRGGEMEGRAVRDPVRADQVQRTKPDPRHSSQGPLSSIRAAIKRSRSHPQIDHSGDRRRPEITILSAEPLANSSWFPGASGVFTSTPPPPSPRGPEASWLESTQEDPQPPPSYDQVIKEKTQEGPVPRPTAAPRTSACTSSSATQTDPLRAETSASAHLGPASGTVKKPPKPPRPSLLKTQREGPSIGEPDSTSATHVKVSVATENQNESESCIEPHNTKDSTHSIAASRQWDGSAKCLYRCLKVPIDSPVTPVDSSIPFSDSRSAECPVPLPRNKKTQRKNWTEEGTVQTLVSLSDNGPEIQVSSSHYQDESSPNKYIQDLQQVFGANNSFFGIDEWSECNSTEQITEADLNMSAIHSQRDVTARIAAFETQMSTEEVVAVQPPKPLPRGAKPAVSSKPSLASRASFKYSGENNNEELPSTLMPQKPLVAARSQKPLPAPRPQHGVKPGGYPSLEGLQKTMPSRVPVLPNARPSIKAKVESLERQQEEINLRTPPVPAVKTFIESVVPNNHCNAVKSTEEGYYDMPPENLQEQMPRKVPVLPPSRLSIKAKVKSLDQQENQALGPPVPLGKLIKEPLVPNLNLNNHNSTYLATENDVHTPSNFIGDLQETLASRVPVLPNARPSIKAKVESLEQQQEEINLRTPPVPAVKTFIESVVPNNHYHAVKSTEEGYYDMPPENLQEQMPRKVPVLPPSRLSIKAKVKSLDQQENQALGPPVPLGKPIKEPLVPNHNLNNHNSTYLATETDVHTPSNFIGDLQETLASRAPVLPNARPSIKAKVESLEQQLKQEDHVLAPLGPVEKHFKEPLVPNFNHHNSTFIATQDPFYDTPSDLQETMPSRVAVLPPTRPTPTVPFKEPPTPDLSQEYPFMATEDDEWDGPANFLGGLQETNATKVLPPSRPSIKYKVMILEQQQENIAPAPPVKPFKEPLEPNFNHHNSPFMATEDPYYDRSNGSIGDHQETMPSRVAVLPPSRPSPRVPPKPFQESPTPTFSQDSFHRSPSRAPLRPQQSLDSSSLAYKNKASISRRPTTIRVNSMTSRSLSLDTPPALPTQMPVGLKPRPVHLPDTWGATPPYTETFDRGHEPTLPPRPIQGKVLPPRPNPAKAGPARPPPPGTGSSGGASPLQASRQGVTGTTPTQRAPTKRGPALPPRPRPGHKLYNNYTLGLPHGIAVCSYNGPSSTELSFQKNDVLVLLEEIDHRTVMCQAGEVSGLVKSCHMKVITPLAAQNDPLHQISNPAVGDGDGGLQVQAIHDFDPASPEELGLRAGDVVVMVEQMDEDWYRGTCRGSVGFFPINYVNVLSNSLPPSHEKKKPSATVSGPRCVARFDYEGEHSDELTFSEGDAIGLMEYVGDDWAKGQLGPFVGIFPLNFVEVVEDLPSTVTTPLLQTKIALPGLSARPNIQPEAVKPIQAPKTAGPEWAVALYDFNGQTGEDLSFKQGDRVLVTGHLDTEWWTGRLNGREGIFPRLFVQAQPVPGQAQPNHQQQRPEAGGTRAKALFQFTADCEEELSIQAGDIITNLESLDNEWFLGSLRGKRALVPKNYVQVLG